MLSSARNLIRFAVVILIIVICGLGYVIYEGGKINEKRSQGKKSLERIALQMKGSSGITAIVWDDSGEGVMTISYEGEYPEFIGSLRAFSQNAIVGNIKNQGCITLSLKGDESQISSLLREHRFPDREQCRKQRPSL